MKNIVILQKDEDGSIWCSQISDKGVKYIDQDIDEGYWDELGTIVFDELEEILDKDII